MSRVLSPKLSVSPQNQHLPTDLQLELAYLPSLTFLLPLQPSPTVPNVIAATLAPRLQQHPKTPLDELYQTKYTTSSGKQTIMMCQKIDK
jgi:hypothetical protein